MRWIHSFPVFLALAAASWAGDAPCVGSNCGTSNWSLPITVSSVGNDLSQPSGYIFNFVKFSDRTCENRTSGNPQLVVRTSTLNPLQKMMAMKVALMTAVASGAQVRVHWEGDYCWIDDVLQCGDDACYVPY